MTSPTARDGGTRRIELTVPGNRRGDRLDQALTALLPDLSRAAVQRLIRGGHITLDGRAVRSARRLSGGEHIEVEIPAAEPSTLEPEERTLDVLHEDADLLVINKAAGMTVHPGAGRTSGTLVNALLHHCRDLSGIGGVERPGIVHRLDRETSGVLVVAKNDRTHRDLAAQFKARQVQKTYRALVWGVPRAARGLVDAPIGRHATVRVRMAIRADGRPARTSWEVIEKLGPMALLEVRPETGRTHQIRVHLASLGHSIVGDRLYGGRRDPGTVQAELRTGLEGYDGLALHALRIEFRHPRTAQRLSVEAPVPGSLVSLIGTLKSMAGSAATRR
jgi:23S rRNA pseudouridine1911/1915/1917 synthase